MGNIYQNLEVFSEMPESAQTRKENMMIARVQIDEAIKRLKEFKSQFDEELLIEMDDQEVTSFPFEHGMHSIIVSKGKKKKTTINTKALTSMLTSGDPNERGVALNALSGSQSAWKAAQVKVAEDTLGTTGLIETTYEDKVVIKEVPVEVLEQRRIAKEQS